MLVRRTHSAFVFHGSTEDGLQKLCFHSDTRSSHASNKSVGLHYVNTVHPVCPHYPNDRGFGRLTPAPVEHSCVASGEAHTGPKETLVYTTCCSPCAVEVFHFRGWEPHGFPTACCDNDPCCAGASSNISHARFETRARPTSVTMLTRQRTTAPSGRQRRAARRAPLQCTQTLTDRGATPRDKTARLGSTDFRCVEWHGHRQRDNAHSELSLHWTKRHLLKVQDHIRRIRNTVAGMCWGSSAMRMRSSSEENKNQQVQSTIL